MDQWETADLTPANKPPIERKEEGTYVPSFGEMTTVTWYECPVCEGELHVTHPVDGPDNDYRCHDCGYRWAD